jgi:hypothetical protein
LLLLVEDRQRIQAPACMLQIFLQLQYRLIFKDTPLKDTTALCIENL